MITQVAVQFAPRDQNPAKSGQFSEHFPPHEPADRFCAHTELSGADRKMVASGWYKKRLCVKRMFSWHG
jgi:hypothetical protein